MNPISTPIISINTKNANSTLSIKAVLALSLVLSAGTVYAQDETPRIDETTRIVAVEPMIDFIMPQRRIGARYIAEISAVNVDVRLTDTLASTHIEITVVNNGSRTSQARLVLPVPDGSVIRSFGIDGLGDEPTAKLLPREEANRRYNEIVRKMIDPGLLEFVGNAMIQSSVFPVEPGASRTMTIVYEQTLDAHRGRIEYVLPRSAGYNNSSIKWAINIDLEAVDSLGPVFSPSHPIVSKITGQRTMKVGVPILNEPGAFRLYAVLGTQAEATTLLYADPENPTSGYFMFVADAPEIDKNVDVIPREITIVIDRSGSMNGEKIMQARQAAKQIVLGMNMGEFVHIIDYADDVRSFSDIPTEITKETLPTILQYIENIQSRGGTNLHGALMESLVSDVTQGHLPMVLFLTDGLATVGVTDESAIRAAAEQANTHDRRVFTFGIGYNVNVPLLDGLAMDTRAESTFVLPNEDVEMKVGQVFDKLDGPVIIEPVFGTSYIASSDTIPQLTMIEPSSLGDLFSGSRVVVLGKYENLTEEPAHMWIASGVESEQESVVLEADYTIQDSSSRHAFIARLWAQKRIDSLINQIRLDAADGTEPNEELVDEIVRLSLEHGIMSEYTAFLAEEDESIELANRRDNNGRIRAARTMQNHVSIRVAERSGKDAMSQTANRENIDADSLEESVSEGGQTTFSGGTVYLHASVSSNNYFNADMEKVVVNTIQRGYGATLYKKSTQWVDAQLGEHAGEEPELTVEFDTEEYWVLINDLVSQNRQWILANRGDVYFMNHSKRVLVHNPK